MLTVPITILDDFLNNPETIREFGLSLEYAPSATNNFPGKRTRCLSQIHSGFFNYLNHRILNLFFPSIPKTWSSSMFFHLSKDLEKTGWIHQDSVQITSIIYLSPQSPKVNKGTSLYELKQNSIHPYNNQRDYNLNNDRISHYSTNKIPLETYNNKTLWEENTFNKILDIPDKFNRLVCFDPYTYHANNNIKSEDSKDRLTLITFIKDISHPTNFPIPRSKRTISM